MPTPSRYALLASLFLTAGFSTVVATAEDASTPTPAAAKESATDLIAKAKAALEAERFADALAAANQAVLADPADYKTRYYQSFAHLTLGQFDDADAAAAKALALAPEDDKPKVQKLIATIKERRASSAGVGAADAALASGLAGKAARLYAQAWATDKSKPEIAMTAAQLYAEKLGQPAEAARLLREVLRADAGNRPQAEAALKKMAPELRKMAKAKVKEAGTHANDAAKALAALQQAEEADPSYCTIYYTRAFVVAQTGSAADLVKALEGLAQHDLAGVEDLAGLPGMGKWMKDPAIIECLTDLVGPVKIDEIKGMVGKLSPTVAGGKIDFPRETLRDIRQEVEWGDAEAQWNLGFRYEVGDEVPKDQVEAVKWYRKAADQGYANAQTMLGYCYSLGKLGITKDKTEAQKWFRKAAEQGDGLAQCHLGNAYKYGAGVPKDKVEGVKWYRMAAEQGYANAQHALGDAYASGEGAPKDHAEATKWYRKEVEQYQKKAEQGDADSQYKIGEAYAAGKGVPQDPAEAAKWFRMAAEQGNGLAQCSLGECYRDGNGVPKDRAEAVKWFRKAAEQGYDTTEELKALGE